MLYVPGHTQYDYVRTEAHPFECSGKPGCRCWMREEQERQRKREEGEGEPERERNREQTVSAPPSVWEQPRLLPLWTGPPRPACAVCRRSDVPLWRRPSGAIKCRQCIGTPRRKHTGLS